MRPSTKSPQSKAAMKQEEENKSGMNNITAGGSHNAESIQRSAIIFLFDVVWPRMLYSSVFRDKCLARLPVINSLFEQYSSDANKLLLTLDTLPDVGLVIGSGLIYSANRNSMVPFDKWTMGWALELRIIPDNKISAGKNYTRYCENIVSYIKQSDHLKSIFDFVREAEVKAQFECPPE